MLIIALLLLYGGALLLFFAGNISAREVNILHFAWLTQDGKALMTSNPDAATSIYIVPLAIKHFNDRYGGVLPLLANLENCNATIRLDGGILDDEGSSSIAMQEFVGSARFKRVDMILGPLRSDVAQPIAVAAGALNMPQISHLATSESLSDKLIYPSFFRTIGSDGLKTAAIATLFKQWGYRKVGMIFVNDVFGIDWKDSFFDECERRRMRVVTVSYDAEARGIDLETQVTQALTTLRSERISVIVYVSLTSDFVFALAKAAVDLDWLDGKLYMGNSNYLQQTLQSHTNYDILKRFLNGALAIVPHIHPNTYWDSLREHWKQMNLSSISSYLANGTGNLPENFFQRGQEKEMYESWAIAYDTVVSIGLAVCGSKSTLYENLRDTNFKGTSGTVRFDSNLNRDPTTISLTLVNTVVRGDAIVNREVAQLLSFGGNWTFSEQIIFSGNATEPPKDIAPPQHVIDSIPFGARIFGWVEAGISMAAALAVFLYVRLHKKQQVIIESQPLFMKLLACGCLVLGASIIPLSFESDLGCMLFPWLFALGFTLALASLIAKSVRVAILWYQRGPLTKRNKSVRATVLLTGIFLCLGVEVVILIVWQVLAPLKFTITAQQTDSDGYPLYSSAVCASDSDTTTILFALLVVFICLVVFVTMWVSFWVRNAPEKYQETKMTAVAGVCMFQVFFVGLPATAAVWESALPRFLVLSSITFLLCMIILITMFVPKIFRSRFAGMETPENTPTSGRVQPPGNNNQQSCGGVVRSEVRAIRSGESSEEDAAEILITDLIMSDNKVSDSCKSSSQGRPVDGSLVVT